MSVSDLFIDVGISCILLGGTSFVIGYMIRGFNDLTFTNNITNNQQIVRKHVL